MLITLEEAKEYLKVEYEDRAPWIKLSQILLKCM